ncbi:RNA polymerase sigma-70 factor [Hymenobacter arizonensis]|uniref:RNA polymerase sigma-70 factor, ECF subfamily n=1 Tax=Hymenobacter arizonensis TaxID=1227077 RepID=A0A1I5UFW6_HYMAR|nr:RNA polymerase sigma-70 factor [Hymenobacter arizonensis]SFP94173.1 RNA polymerase sigma-70 factor, ECF subfamily [Hymenobacter arizonensis]
MLSETFDYPDAELLLLLQQGQEQAFAAVFRRYHVELFRFALKYVQLPALAEDLVQDVLLYLWERRRELAITASLKSYLYAAVKHRALDYLKSQYARQVPESELPEYLATPTQADTHLQAQELTEAIGQAVDELPEKCRLIFRLSRNAELSYQEIATQLGLSVKTVEAQMGIALRKLRTRLQGYEMLIIWGLIVPLLG